MLREIKVALRQLAKTPGFTVIAVITVALAIGATTAVLSLVNGLLVRPLPYREPRQIVLLLQHFKSQNLDRIPVSPPEFKDYETRARSFEKLERKIKASGHHADHRETLAVEKKFRPDDVRIAVEPALPQSRADYDDIVPAQCAFFRLEKSALNR